jgi:hypothetical protein
VRVVILYFKRLNDVEVSHGSGFICLSQPAFPPKDTDDNDDANDQGDEHYKRYRAD